MLTSAPQAPSPDESAPWSQALHSLVDYLPNLLGALAVLVVGWLLALAVSRLLDASLRKARPQRVADWLAQGDRPTGVDVAPLLVRGTFYLLMLFVLVGFFQVLGLTLVTEPLQGALNEVAEFAPRLVAAALLLLLAWAIASATRLVVSRALSMTKLDQRLSEGVDGEETALPVSRTVGDTVYWLVLLLFLPAVLDALELQGLLEPIQSMLAKMVGYLPNLFGAGIILLVGWFLARIVQRVVTSLLASAGADALSERVGLARLLGAQKLSKMLGLLSYVLILVPVLVASLNALELEAVSAPASDMLDSFLGVLPNVFGALIVIAFAWVVGRLVATLVTNLLSGVGFDLILDRLGLSRASDEAAEAHVEGRSPSSIAGFLVLLAIMLVASMEAFRLVGFDSLAGLIQEFYRFAGNVLLGLVILALGLWVANVVHARVGSSATANATFLALAARVAILVVAGAMAIQQMGIGSEVTSLVLTALLGAGAVALALAFGLGARESAGRLVDDWLKARRAGS